MRIYNFCELHDEDYREIFHKGKLCVRTKWIILEVNGQEQANKTTKGFVPSTLNITCSSVSFKLLIFY